MYHYSSWHVWIHTRGWISILIDSDFRNCDKHPKVRLRQYKDIFSSEKYNVQIQFVSFMDRSVPGLEINYNLDLVPIEIT